jgi:membrane-associated phospholipid phosphatase
VPTIPAGRRCCAFWRPRLVVTKIGFLLVFSLFFGRICTAQNQSAAGAEGRPGRSPSLGNADQNSGLKRPAKSPPGVCSLARLDKCALNVAVDQAGIWTSPLRINREDAIWLIPFAAAVGASVSYDPQAMNKLGNSQAQVHFGQNVSRYSSPWIVFGISGSLYLAGTATRSDRLRQTGLLAGEAVVDATALAEGLKFATQRDRPYQGDGNGNFWPNGTRAYNSNGSMPSAHSAAMWAFARVISHEYSDRPLLKFGAYGAAITVSAARVLSREHFPSDVLVGSAFGYLTAGYVLKRRAAQYEGQLGLSLEPLLDRSTRSYGVTMTLTPQGDLNGCQLTGVSFVARELHVACRKARHSLPGSAQSDWD